jgi:hypothetical protein
MHAGPFSNMDYPNSQRVANGRPYGGLRRHRLHDRLDVRDRRRPPLMGARAWAARAAVMLAADRDQQSQQAGR